MFQLFLRLCSACSVGVLEVDSFGFCKDSTSFSFFSFSFSLSLVGKSKAEPDPGVLGVLDCPKDAKAPVPNPKAEEAPTPGDLADEGEAELNGFDLLCGVDSPNLRPENDRDPSALFPSLPSRSRVGSESLSLLLK